MTQDPTRRSPATSRRSARAGRNSNKPILVTSTEAEDNGQVVAAPTLAESMAEIQEQNPPIADSPARPARKLPGFFSNVGKRAQADSASEIDAAQARIARANRTKGTSAKATGESKTPAKIETKKETPRGSTPARPASPFKTKYFIGMGIYLLGANFVGIFVTNFFSSNHIDTVLTRFSLFGGQIVISTSTLVFLGILVILLILLARFDLIPRSFSALSGSPSRKGGTGNTTRNSQNTTTDGSKSPPPTMKQGVKGADDDLYQEYRANQRRKR